MYLQFASKDVRISTPTPYGFHAPFLSSDMLECLVMHDTGQLSESPFLMHPKENQTAGYYQDPIAILDFASLYPSIFMAHLCYTTLLHPKDASSLPADLVNTSPTGAKFVVSSVRHGVLPRICGALIRARKLARDRMAAVDVGRDERAVLDGRQKALKVIHSYP
jgi:DNA polymerase delta subunit 1